MRINPSAHLELLADIAGQLGHSIEKTIVVEDLIVSAVNGLAKLAESRDPVVVDAFFESKSEILEIYNRFNTVGE